MFKYGSFRNFVIKIFVGTILFVFGLIYLGSLYSYSPNDPGFSQLNNSLNENKINNVLGFFGLPVGLNGYLLLKPTIGMSL